MSLEVRSCTYRREVPHSWSGLHGEPEHAAGHWSWTPVSSHRLLTRSYVLLFLIGQFEAHCHSLAPLLTSCFFRPPQQNAVARIEWRRLVSRSIRLVVSLAAQPSDVLMTLLTAHCFGREVETSPQRSPIHTSTWTLFPVPPL